MAYDDYLNKDKGLRGGVMDAPDRQVRIAQAKIAAGAAHLLTAKEWNRIAERQRLEQESLPMAMTASEQANRARAAMNVGRPRFTAEELLAASQPGTVPAPDEFVVRNIPGRGESTMVRGVPIVGGPMRSGELPTPDEGYGYVMGPSGYISTTPYGMVRGAKPQLGDITAQEAPVEAPQPVVQPTVQQAADQLVRPAYPEAAGYPFGLSTFEKEAYRPSQLPVTGYQTANQFIAQGNVPMINIPPSTADAARYAAAAGGGGFVRPMGEIPAQELPVAQAAVPTISLPPSSAEAARYAAAAGGGGFVTPMGGPQVPVINVNQEAEQIAEARRRGGLRAPLGVPSSSNIARYAAAAGGGGFVSPMGMSNVPTIQIPGESQSFIGNLVNQVSNKLSQPTAIYPRQMAANATIAARNAIYGKPEAKMINLSQEQVPVINIDEAQGVPVPQPVPAKMINIPQQAPVRTININEAYGVPVSQNAAPLTTDVLGIASYGKQRMSPDIVANQLLGRPMPAQGGATNVMPASRFNMMPQGGVTPAITSGTNEMGQTMASGRFNMMPQQSPAMSVLPPIPPAVQQPTENLVPPSDMTVSAMIPEGITGQTELAPQYVEQPMPMAIPQASQFQTYRPPELRIPQFNPRNIMQQPSVSETLRLPGELKAYEAQTKAQIAAYRANVQAQRNAFKDAIDAELKSVDIVGKKASAISTQIANQFAMGGPQYGTFDVDGKTFGYIRSSPTSITKFEIKPSESTTERNYNFRVGINEALTNKILTGDPKDRLEAKGMWNSLGYQPNEFETYAGQVAAQPEGAGMTQEQQARALLAEAGGDKDKARKLAKDRGIKF
jgi:hypothetical protein